MIFQKHQVVTKNGLLMAILTISKKSFSEEFSLENDNLTTSTTHLKEATISFLNETYPDLTIKVVRIMIGKVPFMTFHVPD